jgi:tight adherence protein C
MHLFFAILLGSFMFLITIFILPGEKVRRRTINEIQKNESIFGDFEGFINFFIDQNRKIIPDMFKKFSSRYDKKLLSAGLDPAEINCEQFFVLKELSALFFFLIGLAMFSAVKLLFALVFLAIGFKIPNLILSRIISNRKAEILKELPYVIDLLALAVEAGLDFPKAIQKIVEKSEPNVVIEELYTFTQEIKLGKTMDEALRYMSERIDVMAFFAVAEALTRATRFGGDIAKVLIVQSEQMRMVRFQMAEELAAKASIKLLIPLVVFVFPASLCVMVGPAAIRLLKELTSA